MQLSQHASKGFRTIATLGVVAVLGCIDHSVTGPQQVNNADLAVRLLLLNGNSQTGAVAAALATPITVRVLDANGLGVKGATVTFSVRQGGGKVSAPTAQSDSNGSAITTWTLGTTTGANQLVAILNSRSALDSVTFTATAVAGSAATVALTTGGSQNGSVGTALTTAISVKVTDAQGNPVSGVAVAWGVAAGNGGGFASPASSTSGADGSASTSWTLGGLIGAQSLSATVAGLSPLTVSATAQIGSGATMQIDNGDAQNGLNSGTLPTYLRVQVLDSKNTPITGARVTWAAATGGGTVSKLSGTTDASGRDSVQWTLGATLGAQTATATVTGVAAVTFKSNAIVGTPASLKITNGNGQIGKAATALATPLTVQVKDAGGNPLSGVQVGWSQASTNTDGYVAPSPALTDASGNASVTWTLGGNSGTTVLTNTVTASLPGFAAVPAVAFTATARPAPRIRFISGTTSGQPSGTQRDTTGATLSDTLVVQVYDPSTNTGVQGQAVSWAPQAGDAVDGKSVNSVVTTDNLGYAKTVWILRANSGAAIAPSSIAKRMIATASGIGEVEFRAIVFAGRAVVLTLNVPALLKADSTTTVTATLKDANGNPVAGATVSWTLAGQINTPASPATGANTGADGTTSLVLRWKNVQGSADVTVTTTTSATGPYSISTSVSASRSYAIIP